MTRILLAHPFTNTPAQFYMPRSYSPHLPKRLKICQEDGKKIGDREELGAVVQWSWVTT